MSALNNKFRNFFSRKGTSFTERVDFDWTFGVVTFILLIIVVIYFGIVEIQTSLNETPVIKNTNTAFSVDTRAMDRVLERISAKEKMFKLIPNAPVNEAL